MGLAEKRRARKHLFLRVNDQTETLVSSIPFFATRVGAYAVDVEQALLQRLLRKNRREEDDGSHNKLSQSTKHHTSRQPPNIPGKGMNTHIGP